MRPRRSVQAAAFAQSWISPPAVGLQTYPPRQILKTSEVGLNPPRPRDALDPWRAGGDGAGAGTGTGTGTGVVSGSASGAWAESWRARDIPSWAASAGGGRRATAHPCGVARVSRRCGRPKLDIGGRMFAAHVGRDALLGPNGIRMERDFRWSDLCRECAGFGEVRGPCEAGQIGSDQIALGVRGRDGSMVSRTALRRIRVSHCVR